MVDPMKPRAGGTGGRSRAWSLTALSGIALLVLVTMHMVANHFVVDEIGGLRTYAQVLDYVGNPVIVVLELGLLVAVTVHAMLGLRSVLFDLGLTARAERLVTRGLAVLGALTIGYGVVLIGVLASRA